MIKAVIFDLDGVIADTEYTHFRAWQEAFKEFGYVISETDFKSKLQSRSRAQGIRNMDPNVSDDLLKRIALRKGAYFEKAIINKEIRLYKDALELLDKLKELDLLLAVASASSVASDVIKVCNLSNYFSCILSGKDVVNNKPHPEIYLKTLDKIKLCSDEVLVIEDSNSGINSALSAGLKVIAVDRNQDLPSYTNNVVKVTTLYDVNDKMFM